MKKLGNKEEIVVYGEISIQLLQHIIDGMSSKSTETGPYAIDFTRLKKLKISIKNKFGQPYTKCKIRYEDADEVPVEETAGTGTDSNKPEYKVLKKRLEKTFKAIDTRLKNGSFPANLEMELFCKNAEMMTTYPGYGDKMYPAFLQLIHEFQEYFHQYDIVKCQERFNEIRAMRKACHAEK